MTPTVVTFGLSPSYGLLTAREAHEWFVDMMREHEEFEVETDRAREWPLSFWSETMRQVVVEYLRVPYVICTRLLRSSTYPAVT